MIVAGVGNALFHLGAGGLVLRSAGRRAAPAGVFVAPGALGLGLGMWMGRTGQGSTFPIYVALAFAVIALMPRWPATAFGLPCLALVAGSFPTFFPAGKQLFGDGHSSCSSLSRLRLSP